MVGKEKRKMSVPPNPPPLFPGPRAGAPAAGRTPLARIIAAETNAVFLPFSAVLAGIKEIKEALADLKTVRTDTERPAILFIDEIHRFNKAQQDALLPFVEDGTVTLFGTTTENPSFEIRNALLSRCRVLVLDPLSAKDVETIVRRGRRPSSRTGTGMNTTPSSPPFTRACAVQTPTPPCTGWRGCSPRGRTPPPSPGGWSPSAPRTRGTPRPGGC